MHNIGAVHAATVHEDLSLVIKGVDGTVQLSLNDPAMRAALADAISRIDPTPPEVETNE